MLCAHFLMAIFIDFKKAVASEVPVSVAQLAKKEDFHFSYEQKDKNKA